MAHTLVTVFYILSFSIAAVFSSESKVLEKLDVKIVSPKQLRQFLDNNPDAVLVPLERNVSSNSGEARGGYSIRYTDGSRVAGDRLLGAAADRITFPSPRGMELTIVYPPSGHVVTYVNILVEQSSNSGEAYIVEGGIGHPNISILVKAHNTLYVNYRAEIFGY